MKNESIMNYDRERFLEVYSNYIHNLRDKIINKCDIISTLNLARVYGDLCWLNYDGMYEDIGLEDIIFDHIKDDFTEDISECDKALKIGSCDHNVVLLVSELHSVGGHSEIVVKWIESMPSDFQHTLLVTRSIDQACRDRIESMAPIYLCDDECVVSSIRKVLSLARGFKYVVLHIHPNDIVSVMAARLLASVGCYVIFYNHADHVFSYGIGSANVVCEISTFGQGISKRSGRVKCKSFHMDIPLAKVKTENNSKFNEDIVALADAKIILSCGSLYKFKSECGIFYGDFIDAVLAMRSDVVFVLVGPNGNEPYWKEGQKKWGDSVRFMGTMSRSKYGHMLSLASVYVDSFPITGGTAFPEAVMAGKLCVALDTPIQGYTDADCLRVKSIEILAKKTSLLLDGDSKELAYSDQVRRMVVKNQSESSFSANILRLYQKKDSTGEFSDRKNVSDNSWFETNWSKSSVIMLPFSDSIVRLSYMDRFWFFMHVLRISRFCTLKSLLKCFCQCFYLSSLLRS